MLWHHLWEGQTEFSSFLGMEERAEYLKATNACWVLTWFKLEKKKQSEAVDWLTYHSGPDSDDDDENDDEKEDNDDKTKAECDIPDMPHFFYMYYCTFFPSCGNRNGTMAHQLLSAFVPLTPQWWQHWVCSFKWAFAHSLRITTTASVLAGLLSNWTAQRSLKKTSSV